MSRGSGIEVVCFDWGGVILKHCRSWREACDAAGISMHAQVEAPHLMEQRRTLSQAYQRGQIEERAFFAGLIEATDRLYSEHDLVRLHDAWLIAEYDGVAAVIDRLHTQDRARTALLSNTNASHWRRHSPIDGRPADFPTAATLHVMHASHLLGHAKPDAEIYHAFQDRIGVRGPAVLFFDDLPDNIAAARRLGWDTVLIDHTGDTATQIETALTERGLI